MHIGQQLGFMAGISASLIQSIQNFTITIANGATTGTASISSVTDGNTIIVYDGTTSSQTGINTATGLARVDLSGTTVTATRNTSTTTTVTLKGSIVELKTSAVKTINRGTSTIAVSGTTNTATISAITTANSAIFFNGISSAGTSGTAQSNFANAVITNTTTLTFTRINAAATAMSVSYSCLELNSGILNSSTQSGSIVLNSVTSNTATISSVGTGQCMLAWGGFYSDATTAWELPYIQQTSGTVVTATRVLTNGSYTASFTNLEFKTANINNVQRGTITVAATSASNTASLSPSVDVSLTIPNFLGSNNAGGVNNESTNLMTLTPTNSSTYTADRNAADASNAGVLSWEAINFN